MAFVRRSPATNYSLSKLLRSLRESLCHSLHCSSAASRQSRGRSAADQISALEVTLDAIERFNLIKTRYTDIGDSR